MTRTKILFVGTLLACIIFVACKTPKTTTLTVIHSNDTHCQIEAYITKEGDTLGGVARRNEAICKLRKENPDILLVDGGDFSQGTPYFHLFEGRLEIELMNRMGYDVATIGNHEFDRGIDDLAERLSTAKFTIVCANYKFNNKKLSQIIKPYTIIERGGMKIGVFGLTTSLEGLTTKQNTQQLEYLDPVEVSKQMVSILKSKGCKYIICLSHLGFVPEPGRPMCDTILANKISNVDLIVSGHSHLVRDTIINNIRIVQTGEKGLRISEVKITK